MPLCACSRRPWRLPTASERAAHVTEQFGFEQRFGDGAAVERHEALRASRAVVMDGARHHFLARTGLAGDQDGAVGHRHGLEQVEQLLHHRTLADDALEAVTLVELRTEVRVLRLQPALFERRLERVCQFVDLEGFADEVGGAALDGFHRVLHRPVARHDDGYDVRVAFDGRVHHLGPADPWHPEVGDDGVEREVGKLGQGRLSGIRLFDGESAVGELLGHGRPQGRLVFDEQQMFRRISHLAGGGILTQIVFAARADLAGSEGVLPPASADRWCATLLRVSATGSRNRRMRRSGSTGPPRLLRYPCWRQKPWNERPSRS